MLTPETIVERYRVEKELGRGACAVVYRVRHTKLDSPHALKVLLWKSPALRQRMLQEGKVQASLQHPNIVPVTDVVELGEQMALVMPFIDGPDLEGWLAERTISQDTAESLFREIIAGLGAAHAHGVIHRDLKPGNILMQQVDGRWVPRISDFGIARLLTEGATGLTRTGAAIGTPGYMAPEQFRDGQSAGVRADIWALGCIFYEMLLGVSPFQGENMAAIELATTAGTYTPPELLKSHLPDRIQRAIRGCLKVNPDERIPDCATLLRVLDGEEWEPIPAEKPPEKPATLVPSATSPGTWLPPTATPTPPSRWPLAVGALLLLLLGSGGGYLLSLRGAPEEPSLTAPVEEPPAAEPVEEPPAEEVPAEVVDEPAEEPVEEPPAEEAPAEAPPAAEPVAEAAPVEEPAEASPAPPPPPKPATVSVRGDAEEVWLERSGRRQGLGAVPPGTYKVFARLADVGTITAPGSLNVAPGDAITLTCSTAFMGCKW